MIAWSVVSSLAIHGLIAVLIAIWSLTTSGKLGAVHPEIIQIHLTGNRAPQLDKPKQQRASALQQSVFPTRVLFEAPPPFADNWQDKEPPALLDDTDKIAEVIEIEPLPLPDEQSTENGIALLRVLVSTTGNPDAVEVVNSSLPAPYTNSLVNAFYRARYSPASIGGKSISSWRTIEIRLEDINLDQHVLDLRPTL